MFAQFLSVAATPMVNWGLTCLKAPWQERTDAVTSEQRILTAYITTRRGRTYENAPLGRAI